VRVECAIKGPFTPATPVQIWLGTPYNIGHLVILSWWPIFLSPTLMGSFCSLSAPYYITLHGGLDFTW